MGAHMELLFDVRFGRNGEAITTVQCSNCAAVAKYEVGALRVGEDVSCTGCGRRTLVTPDNWEQIAEKVRLARKRWNEGAVAMGTS